MTKKMRTVERKEGISEVDKEQKDENETKRQKTE